MTQFSDAAMLKGEYSNMLKEPPKESEWKKASCENGAEAAAQEVAKHIFAMRQALDPATERLEVTTFSSRGPVRVLGIVPGEGDLVRIDGMMPDTGAPVSIIQHVTQMSLTFSKLVIENPANAEEPIEEDDDGLQIGFVIFDELSKRKKVRDAAKRKTRKPGTGKKKK